MAACKALLAFQADYKAKTELRSITGETITDPATLTDQLEQIRSTGIATEVEEAFLGECAAAAPVFDSTAEATGAIGLVVPVGRWPLEPEAIDVLDESAAAAAVESAVQQFGRIDIVVNNAGRGLLAAVEEATDAAARAVLTPMCSARSTCCAPSCPRCGRNAQAGSSTCRRSAASSALTRSSPCCFDGLGC